MNSALKPVLPQPGVPQPGGQSSPAKGNVANANHAVGLPQGAQNSLHSVTNNLVGQNLTHHAPPPQAPPHAVPSMAPVTANMAQMAQNMSHHGNLSHVTQNSVPTPSVASPSKSSTSPLSLVQDKVNVVNTVNTSQPLALTRTPEKKEPDSTGTANGTVDTPKPASNTPSTLKPQNPEPNKEKQDIAKTSPSTPKPPEKPTSVPNTPQKVEPASTTNQVDGPAQPKVATANEPPEKSPSKPTELKPSPAADVAPSQSDSKPPETANDNQLQEKVLIPEKQEIPPTPPIESAKTEAKPEEKVEEAKVEKPQPIEEKKEELVDTPKKVEQVEKPPIVEEKIEEKKVEPKPVKVETKPKSTLKLATVTPPMRKRRQASPSKATEGPSSSKKLSEGDNTPDTRMKRNRTKVQLYQSPTPELAMATKLSASAVGRATPPKPNDDKLIVFYKNEYLAVRNAEGSFYVCQAMQNVYRTTRKIKIRWLSQDKTLDPSGETYKPDFYDVTDMECVLTTLSLGRAPAGGGAQVLKAAEEARATSILQRALRAERGGATSLTTTITEEHPDGLDLSLYKDESQLEKKSRKRNSSKSSPPADSDDDEKVTREVPPPAKKVRSTPKRSPKSGGKSKATPPPPTPPKQINYKRKPASSTPSVAAASKTATALTDKANKAKSTPTKRTPVKLNKEKTNAAVATPRSGRRAGKELKGSPAAGGASTSTGRPTRTPLKPPAKK